MKQKRNNKVINAANRKILQYHIPRSVPLGKFSLITSSSILLEKLVWSYLNEILLKKFVFLYSKKIRPHFDQSFRKSLFDHFHSLSLYFIFIYVTNVVVYCFTTKQQCIIGSNCSRRSTMLRLDIFVPERRYEIRI